MADPSSLGDVSGANSQKLRETARGVRNALGGSRQPSRRRERQRRGGNAGESAAKADKIPRHGPLVAVSFFRHDSSTAMAYIDTQLFINGQWQAPAEGRTLPVVNPATGKEIGRVAHAGRPDLERAVEAAQ